MLKISGVRLGPVKSMFIGWCGFCAYLLAIRDLRISIVLSLELKFATWVQGWCRPINLRQWILRKLMKCALTRMRTLRLGRGAATVVPAVLCSLARNNLLLLQAEHVLQMQHLLSAGVELLLLFHTESAEPVAKYPVAPTSAGILHILYTSFSSPPITRDRYIQINFNILILP